MYNCTLATTEDNFSSIYLGGNPIDIIDKAIGVFIIAAIIPAASSLDTADTTGRHQRR